MHLPQIAKTKRKCICPNQRLRKTNENAFAPIKDCENQTKMHLPQSKTGPHLAPDEVDELGDGVEDEDGPVAQEADGPPVLHCGVHSQQEEGHAHVSKPLHLQEPVHHIVRLLAL